MKDTENEYVLKYLRRSSKWMKSGCIYRLSTKTERTQTFPENIKIISLIKEHLKQEISEEDILNRHDYCLIILLKPGGLRFKDKKSFLSELTKIRNS